MKSDPVCFRIGNVTLQINENTADLMLCCSYCAETLHNEFAKVRGRTLVGAMIMGRIRVENGSQQFFVTAVKGATVKMNYFRDLLLIQQ
jgi:hypothetical protein